ncbi:hypothetical protein IMY05_C4464000400 [Salix suchowensis]|nr:hypothetical protein IMY05_C4464000400 [Salix suchowensis]
MGHWVPETPYRAHLQANVDEPEVYAFGIIVCSAHTVTISPNFATQSCEQWTMPTNITLKGMFPLGSQKLSAFSMALFSGMVWGTCKKEKGGGLIQALSSMNDKRMMTPMGTLLRPPLPINEDEEESDIGPPTQRLVKCVLMPKS